MISFSDMLKCYRASLEDSNAREHVFSEMKILGFDESEMRLPNISDAMFGCLQQLEQLGDQVDNDTANRMVTVNLNLHHMIFLEKIFGTCSTSNIFLLVGIPM